MVIGKPPAGQLYVWLCTGPPINITNNINTSTYISRPAAATNKDNRRGKDGTESDCSPHTHARTLYQHCYWSPSIYYTSTDWDTPMGYFSGQFYSVASSLSRCLQQNRNKETNKMETYDKPAQCVLVLVLSWCISLPRVFEPSGSPTFLSVTFKPSVFSLMRFLFWVHTDDVLSEPAPLRLCLQCRGHFCLLVHPH